MLKKLVYRRNSNLQISSDSTSKIKRRNFFGKIGKGLAGVILINLFPIRLFAIKAEQTPKRKIKVKEHPLAVKHGIRKVNVDE
ncbi:MAG: hypothetical protein ACM34K_02665 [Bacillota bacterium]